MTTTHKNLERALMGIWSTETGGSEAPQKGFCISPLATRPILYTDTVNGGEQACRDDLWAVTTAELNAMYMTLRDAEETLSKERVFEIFRKNCVHCSGNYEVTHGQALNIAKLLTQEATHPAEVEKPRKCTDLSIRLRETADQQPGWRSLLTAAADEIERYYGGMLAWRATAEAKDREAAREQQAPSTAAQERDAIVDIAAERQRQMQVEGWTPEHDDGHNDRSLARAAGCYLKHYIARQWIYTAGDTASYQNEDAPWEWPDDWDTSWWRPKNPRRDLVRAAALIAAEIDRMDRAALAHKDAQGEKA